MIPLRLQIKNFLSYGSELQTIDFRPYHLICLSGKNGHGKSALLDAITWAIWGRARKIAGAAKADEGLLRLGQTHMMVCLDFMFNNKTYRIRREFTFTYGKPYATLDLGILDQTTQQMHSLTDKTIKATQDKIEAMIGLDYESFINTAFLRQGQSNEFSQKSPKERKEILATILGLTRFEHIRKRALEKIKDLTTHKEHTQLHHDRITAELAQAPAIAQQAQVIQQSIHQVTEQEKQCLNSLMLIAQEKLKLSKETQQLELLKFKVSTKQQEIITSNNTLIAMRNRWKSTHRQHLTMPDYQALEQEKNTLSHTLAEQQQCMQKNLVLKEKYVQYKELEQNITQQIYNAHQAQIHEKKLAHERLKIALDQHQKTYDDTKKQHNTTLQEYKQVIQAATALQAALQSHSQLAEHVRLEELRFDKRKSYYQKYITQGNFITKELEGIDHKKQFSHDDGNPSCPLCEQNLSAARKRFLKSKFSKQEQFLLHRIQRLKAVIAKLKELLIQQHVYIKEQQKKQDEHKQGTIKLAELNTNVATLQVSATMLTTKLQQCEQELATMRSQHDLITREIQELQQIEKDLLLKNHEHQKITQELRSLTTEIAKLAYNAEQHTSLMQKHSELERRIMAYNQLQQAIALQIKLKEDIHALIITLKKLKQEHSVLLQELNKYTHLEQQINHITQQEELLNTQLAQHAQAKQTHAHEKGKLEQQQEFLRSMEQEIIAIKKKINDHMLAIEDYHSISTALSKDGLQALLIEDAIPEIEQEANHLLAQLTDNQAQLFIESLRDLKKGGTKETLDIKISDPMGIRPYELFSGGEAFRIDFALRIAISKLLARRAGTSLQTLIIDEGFGSQDEEGLSRIMEAIHKIQDNFAKVIIVSHLPSMKEQFPVHFVIEKQSQGSKVHVIEQG